MGNKEKFRRGFARVALVILALLFAALVIVGIFFSEQSFGLFIGLIVGTTLFAVFTYVTLMFMKLRDQNANHVKGEEGDE
ncbi:MAG: hypothetical protein Q4P30_04540 [Eubacteriales bacterium]|nr:hypothetical protein [Eubacteriales bacterium]